MLATEAIEMIEEKSPRTRGESGHRRNFRAFSKYPHFSSQIEMEFWKKPRIRPFAHF